MSGFEQMIEEVVGDIHMLKAAPDNRPDYIDEKVLDLVEAELEKMKQAKNAKVFFPYYPKGLTDACWDDNDKLYIKLMDVLTVYRNL